MQTTRSTNRVALAPSRRSRRDGIRRVTIGMRAACLTVCAALLGPTTAAAQENPQTIQGSIGVGGTWIDETGDRSLVRERADLFEGVSLRQVDLHYLAPHSVRIDIFAPRVDPVARDAQLRVASRFASGSVRTASNHFIFDPQGALKSQRDLLTADLRVRPVQHVELFGEHSRIDLGGRRQAIVAGDEGELGTSYDQDTATWRGGLRLDGLRSNLEVAYLGREFQSRSAPEADRHVNGVEATLRTRPHARLEAEGLYGWSRTRLLADGTPLESDRVSGRVDFLVRPNLRIGPIGRFEESTDLSLSVRSHIWALGFGVRGRTGRGWGDLDAEWGQRDNRLGTSDVWGLRVGGGYDLADGLQIRGLYQRRERDRQNSVAPEAPAPPLADVVGTLAVQRIEGRLRYRPTPRFTAEALLGRFDKDYHDVQVEQQVWRYGLQGSAEARPGVRLDAGWRLDDAFDTRTTGDYDLRTHVVFGGVDVTAISRLALRARADYYTMQRSLDEWKLLFTAGAEYELLRSLFFGIEYARNDYEDDVETLDYQANVWQLTLRHAFGM